MTHGAMPPWGPEKRYWPKALVACVIAAAVAVLYPRARTVAQRSPSNQGPASSASALGDGSPQQVGAMVAGLNEAQAAERRGFEKAGWSFVKEAPPDESVIALTDDALSKDEGAVFTQIQSNSFSGEQLDRLAILAQKSTAPRIRYAATDALGRSHDEHAQELLRDLYRSAPHDDVKDQAIQLVRPRNLDDGASRFLAGILSDRDAPEGHRRQASFALAMVSLLQPGGGPPEKLLASLGPAERERFMEAYRQVRQGIAHRH